MEFKNYLNELKLVIKNHYILILSFIIISIILQFITIPFLSTILMLILMFYLSRTEEYRQGHIIAKIFQLILFFFFVLMFVLLFSVPATIFLLGYDVVMTLEEFVNSPLISTSMKMGVYISIIFIFVPYRIFDANVNVFKAIAYSYSVIINNFLLFIIIAIFVLGLNLLTIKISALDNYMFLLAVILTVALYKLNVKQILLKGDKNENN